MSTKWTIAILSVPERAQELQRVKGLLEWQIGNREDIQVLVDLSNEEVGKKRQNCLNNAHGEYFNFIDDDDLVALNYIDTIYPLLDGVDYIGFQLQHYHNGTKMKPTYHSLKYPIWAEDGEAWYRNVSHLNPIKTEIAKQGTFAGKYAEDISWAKMVKPATEHYIDEPMYFYFFSDKYSLTMEDATRGNA